MGKTFRKVAVAALALSGCASNTPDSADFLTSAKNHLCVAQVRADQVEVVRLDGRRKRVGLQRHADGNWPLSARVAPDGSFAVGASGRALVAVTLSGTELWRVENVSPLGLPAVTPDGKRIVFTGGGRRLLRSGNVD